MLPVPSLMCFYEYTINVDQHPPFTCFLFTCVCDSIHTYTLTMEALIKFRMGMYPNIQINKHQKYDIHFKVFFNYYIVT